MIVTEVILIIIGIFSICLSFFIKSRNTQETESEIDTVNTRKQFVEQITEVLEMKKEQVISETEEYLNRKSNEKIMEFEEYSSQVIEKIERNHEEVVFMYQMLSDKEDEWKNYISNSKKKEKNMKSAKKMEQKPVKQSVKREEPAPNKDKKEINALNEQMIELHHQGKSVLEISKILHVGQGEVQLILSLYDK